MKQVIAEQKAKGGPSRSTRSQTSGAKSTNSESSKATGTAGRLVHRTPVTNDRDSAALPLFVSDGIAKMDAIGRADDGSDDTLVSPKLSEAAALQGIGKLSAISPVLLQVALKQGEEPQKFSFSRIWTAPRTVLQLCTGSLALVDFKYLVADDDLACEPILIGLPVLQHLQVDTK